MARGRMISKSLSTSEKFAALVMNGCPLAEFCHALFPLLVTHTDDFGRLQGDAFTVKHQCYPASPRSLDEFKAGLTAMHDVELIVWYEAVGKRYVQIVKFEQHQQGLHKRTRSQFPRVPGVSGNDAEVPGQEKGTKEKRSKDRKAAAAAPPRFPQPVENPSDNIGVITKIAHEVIDALGRYAERMELRESVKHLCAARAIDYNGDVVDRAIESALVQRKAAS